MVICNQDEIREVNMGIIKKEIEVEVCDACGVEDDYRSMVGLTTCRICLKRICFNCCLWVGESRSNSRLICKSHLPEELFNEQKR